MTPRKPQISRRGVLTGLTAALASAAFVNPARQNTAQAATAQAAAPPPAHPPYHSIVGLL
ncbi:hypothetical protein ACWD01_30295 [Streptomyces sp. NPDC002835]|jgi:hypothetical protein